MARDKGRISGQPNRHHPRLAVQRSQGAQEVLRLSKPSDSAEIFFDCVGTRLNPSGGDEEDFLS